jgi:hypothetical protein
MVSKPKELEKSLFISPSSGLAASETSKGTSVPSGTKMPKSKKMPDPFGKPSKFWKSECGLCKTENNLEPLMKPYSSEAQRRWAHTSTGKEALGGEAAVHEWDEATKGKKLPEKVKKSEFCKSESVFCKGKIPNIGKQLLPPGGMGVGNMSTGNGGIMRSETESFEHIKHPTLLKIKNLLEKSRNKNKK